MTYGDASVESAECNDTTVTVTVTNKSSVAIEEVVQVYLKALDSPYAPTNPRLCAFSRVHLNGGETRKIDLKLCEDAFLVVNEEGKKVSGGSRFQISAGLGQPDARTRELTRKECISFRVER